MSARDDDFDLIPPDLFSRGEWIVVGILSVIMSATAIAAVVLLAAVTVDLAHVGWSLLR